MQQQARDRSAALMQQIEEDAPDGELGAAFGEFAMIALAVEPSTASVHSPLAMAYRGRGETAQAEAHLNLWRNTEILVPDPLRMELDLVLNSGLSYELRGVRALDSRDFATALEMLRKGLEPATPGKRADIVMIATDALNVGVFTDAARIVVEAVQPANVDTVIIDGRVLKRGGKLTALPVTEVVHDAATSFDAIRKRANWQ